MQPEEEVEEVIEEVFGNEKETHFRSINERGILAIKTLKVEEKLGVKIPREEFRTTETVEELTKAFKSKIKEQENES